MVDDYWTMRADRVLNRTTPLAVEAVASETGGFLHVKGELIVSAAAADSLGLAGMRHFSLKADEQGWLIGPDQQHDLELWTYGGPVPIPMLALQLRQISGEVRIAPHYVLTGEMKPTVPRGGPFGPPVPHTPIVLPPTWGGDAPMVAVLDTGIDPATPAGGSTNGADRVRWNHVDDRDDLGVGPNVPAAPVLASEAGHGSFITALIHRLVEGGLEMAAVAVLDSDGVGSEQTLVEGLKKLRTQFARPPKIVNLSLGAFTDDGGWLTDDEEERRLLFPISQRDLMPLGLANELAHWKVGPLADTVFVCAAGNDNQTRPFWPAAAAGHPHHPQSAPVVVSVASLGVDSTGPSGFTNRGDWVRVCTRGEDILSAYSEGQMVDSVGALVSFPPGGAALWSGTSFAAPVITAELARRCRDDGVTAVEAWKALEATLVPLVPPEPGMGNSYDAFAVRGVRVGD